MHMVDPLFQRILVNECRNKNIPVIFDEVFTGFWRLGTEVGLSFSPLTFFNWKFFSIDWEVFFLLQSAAELLCCLPDIACFGKLMTGGTVPLSATLATDAVFDSFIGDSKVIYMAVGWFEVLELLLEFDSIAHEITHPYATFVCVVFLRASPSPKFYYE